jgi:hypothetical protein
MRRIAEIAVIAKIAESERKTLPQMNADERRSGQTSESGSRREKTE